MLKNIYKKIIVWFFISIWFFSQASASLKDWVDIRFRSWAWWSGSEWPEIQCKWLPWCGKWTPEGFLIRMVDYFIWIVIVLAVFALIISWIMYMISAWEEEKANVAKRWIIWSLIWVILSTIAWWIVFFINSIKF